MEASILTMSLLGLILGLKHAAEPDHVIAVSTIAAESRSIWGIGIFWGLGHNLTLSVISLLAIWFDIQIPQQVSLYFEYMVGLLLLFLGLRTIFQYRRKNVHVHQHRDDEGKSHVHFMLMKVFFIMSS